MSRWIDASDADRQQSAYIIANEKNISVGAVEKDWWVTAILKVLFSLSPAKYMFFKGGTSLSKGWNLIDRFSEDIDIALYRDFYLNELGKDCAKAATNNQVKNLRIVNRDYILGEFAKELESKLIESGLGECKVVPITTKKDGSPSLVGNAFPEIDGETFAEIPTITPTRTFLEKAFLLNEEYQRRSPRSDRMSRHLYDLERLMDTAFAEAALSDMELYQEIIAHRQRFYHVGGVNYELNHPSTIAFCPTGELRDKMRLDYETMKTSMIYGEKLSFDALIDRLEQLENRFRSMPM